MKKEKKSKRILVIGTGGTIAGKGDNFKTSDYTAAQIKIDDLVNEVCENTIHDNMDTIDYFNIDSCDMTFEKLIKLSDFINKNSQKEDYDGFVITHGTDTLEETAYFLNLTVKTQKPVVITGAMRPHTALGADGPMNLYQAISLAKSEEAINKGVLVVFSDTIYSARDVSKINTFKPAAFGQKDLGCLGYMRDENVFFYNSPTKKHTIYSEFDISYLENLPKVEIVMFYPSADIKILDYVSKDCDGIVLAGAGCGNVSTSWSEKVNKIISSGIPVVRSSRIANGVVTYNEKTIHEKGIFAENLSPLKSRILLSLALTKSTNLEEIQKFFLEY